MTVWSPLLNNIAALLLFFSGISSLTYQVIWVRLLGLSIGMTSAAVGAVLAAVFLGMALGSWLSGQIPVRWQGRLKTFAAVEAMVAISALALLPVLLNLDHLMALIPSLGAQLWFRFTVVTLLLAIPAAGLGAAYPLMATTLIRQQQQLTGGLAKLYALHTAGAVTGALVTAFLLFPQWGLDGALYIAVTINVLIALSAIRLDREATTAFEIKDTDTTVDRKDSWIGLLVLSVTGLGAVAVQVGWTKYLAIFTESTFFGFALLLAIFLSGIAIGTWVIKLFLTKIKHPQQFLIVGLILLGLAMFVTRSGLGFIPTIETYLEEQELGVAVANIINYGTVVIMIFPTAFIFGLLFPLSLSLYCGDVRSIGRRAGQGYAANTLAGLAGAVIAGMWLIPRYGTDTLLVIMAIMVTLAALPLVGRMQNSKTRLLVALIVLFLILLGPLMQKISFERMIICMECSKGAYRQGGEPKFIFVKEGHSGVVSLVTYDGDNFILENNGLQESRISLTRSNREEVLLSMLPHLFNPSAKSAFVLGYGSGASAEVLAATELKTIRIVELEPAIVEAMQALKEMDSTIVSDIKMRDVTAVGNLKKGDIRAMDNPRVTLSYNDARNTLLMEPTRYDIIISQPSHPWRAGSASVFTREFFHIVHSRLEENGVFNQWLNLNRIDATTLKSVLRAFYEEFPRGVVFANKDTGDLFLLGSDSALSLDYDEVSKLVMRPEMEHYSWTLGIRRASSLLERYYLMTREEVEALVEGTEANSDLNLLSELRYVGLKEKLSPQNDPRLLLNPYATR